MANVFCFERKKEKKTTNSSNQKYNLHHVENQSKDTNEMKHFKWIWSVSLLLILHSVLINFYSLIIPVMCISISHCMSHLPNNYIIYLWYNMGWLDELQQFKGAKKKRFMIVRDSCKLIHIWQWEHIPTEYSKWWSFDSGLAGSPQLTRAINGSRSEPVAQFLDKIISFH